MLVLSRKIGQTIMIDRNVRVTVTRIVGNRVGIGLEGPDDTTFLRGELVPPAPAPLPEVALPDVGPNVSESSPCLG